MGREQVLDSISELTSSPISEKKPVLIKKRAPVLHLALPLTGSYNVILAYRKIVSAKIHHSIGWSQADSQTFDNYRDQAKRLSHATKQCLLATDGPAPGQSYLEWEQWLGRWDVIADLDAFFGPHLIDTYTESKVILVERDVDEWVKDMDEILITPLFSKRGTVFSRYLEPIAGRRSYWATRRLLSAYFQGDTREGILENMRSAYKSHYNTIRSKVPSDRLLEYKIGSGWEPLCSFLEVPVPDLPFPEEDETAVLRSSLDELHRSRILVVTVRLVVAFMLILGLAMGLWAYLTFT